MPAFIHIKTTPGGPHHLRSARDRHQKKPGVLAVESGRPITNESAWIRGQPCRRPSLQPRIRPRPSGRAVDRGRHLLTGLDSPSASPFRPEFWRSPIRGPWLTSFLGTLLVPAIAVVAVTGFIDHWAHYPQFAGNDGVGPSGDIPVLFHFPTSWPSWSYAVTQGIHVTLGLMVIPFVLAKLWSVMPKLFQRPVVRNVAGALERISLLALVASVLVEFATGILMMEEWIRGGLRPQRRPLLRRLGVRDPVRAACLHQAPDGAPRLSGTRRSEALEGEPGSDQAGAAGRWRARAHQPGRCDDQPPWTARHGRRRVVDHPGASKSESRSAARSGAWRCSHRAAAFTGPAPTTSRSPTPRRGPRSPQR